MRVKNFTPFRGDGRLAMQNVAAAFWQSRMSVGGKVAPVPKLLDIPAFVKQSACTEDGCGRLAPPCLPSQQAAESSRPVK